MKKVLFILSLLLMPFMASAQNTILSQVDEIAQVEDGDGNTVLNVINLPENGQNHYWLSVGNLGVGNKIVQIQIDPAFELFLPLGDNLTDAVDAVEELFKQSKEPRGTTVKRQGCLVFAVPSQDKLEEVTVTSRKVLFSRDLEFMLERDGYTRITYVSKSHLSTLNKGMKFYARFHDK